MLQPEVFLTNTLKRHTHGQAIARILASAIQAVDPQVAVRRFVKRQGHALEINRQVYLLDEIERIIILGLGKASFAMTQPVADILADHSPRGLLIPKHIPAHFLSGFEVQPGGHPVPDRNSLQAGQKVMRLMTGLNENDLVICLISGGGSALMTAPHEGIYLSDLQKLTSLLIANGARIDEINTLRRHLDQLKGGGLAKMTSPAQVVSLILSDVVNSPIESIASGPTSPDPSTREAALAILDKYGLQKKIPPSILTALNSLPETPKPGNALFNRVQNVIVGSNLQAAEAALTQAQSEGFHPHLLGTDWQGEACDVSRTLCQFLKTSANRHRPFCLVAGGETTVTLHGRGRGGRNQELALAAVRELADIDNVLLVALATDGEDGPTDAAGAVVSGETMQYGQAAGFSPGPFLNDNDSYSYFSALGDLLKIGPTGTNVNDLIFCFKW